MSLIDKYIKINNSYKKTFVFHLGAEAGFYSEFNNMIYAILYCLKHQYKFVLYSKDANFRKKNGWDDYFIPFCEVSKNDIHHFVNTRITPPKLSKKQKLQFKLYKLVNPHTKLTFQLWSNFFCPAFEKETFDIPELGINGKLKEAARVIVNMIYRPNQFLNNHIQKEINSIKLPLNYIGINIRRGDKNTEFDYVPLDRFIKEIENYSTCQNIFVFTDDFTVIEEIKLNIDFMNKYKLYHLVDENERGYIHTDFLKLSSKQKEDKILKMLTSMEIMSKADLSLGSYTNNPGFFLGMRMDERKFISLQKKIWYQFEMSDVVNEMSDGMKNFLISVNAKL